MTRSERRLWALLRRKKLEGYRFRRQAPIGPYIADFFCPKARVVVELDGDPHGGDAQIRHDEIRTRWLQANGCRVIRFVSRDVFTRADEIVDAIYRFIVAHPPRVEAPPSGASRHLPPRGGKEGRAK